MRKIESVKHFAETRTRQKDIKIGEDEKVKSSRPTRENCNSDRFQAYYIGRVRKSPASMTKLDLAAVSINTLPWKCELSV